MSLMEYQMRTSFYNWSSWNSSEKMLLRTLKTRYESFGYFNINPDMSRPATCASYLTY